MVHPNQQIIDRLQENIRRLKYTIGMNCWPEGYVANCRAAISSYETQIAGLQ